MFTFPAGVASPGDSAERPAARKRSVALKRKLFRVVVMKAPSSGDAKSEYWRGIRIGKRRGVPSSSSLRSGVLHRHLLSIAPRAKGEKRALAPVSRNHSRGRPCDRGEDVVRGVPRRKSWRCESAFAAELPQTAGLRPAEKSR